MPRPELTFRFRQGLMLRQPVDESPELKATEFQESKMMPVNELAGEILDPPVEPVDELDRDDGRQISCGYCVCQLVPMERTGFSMFQRATGWFN